MSGLRYSKICREWPKTDCDKNCDKLITRNGSGMSAVGRDGPASILRNNGLFQAASLKDFVNLFSRTGKDHVDNLFFRLELIDDSVFPSRRCDRQAEKTFIPFKRLPRSRFFRQLCKSFVITTRKIAAIPCQGFGYTLGAVHFPHRLFPGVLRIEAHGLLVAPIILCLPDDILQ